MTIQQAIMTAGLIGVMACSGPRDTTTTPAAGAESANPATPAEGEPQVQETPPRQSAEAPSREAPTAEPTAAPTAEHVEEPAGPDATPPVCSTFSFDMRGMRHTGPHQVDQGDIQSRANGLIYAVRAAAGEPLVQTFSSGGGSPFTALFTGPSAAARCERARSEVAPPIPEGVTGRRRFRYTRADPCGPCSELVLDAWRGGE